MSGTDSFAGKSCYNIQFSTSCITKFLFCPPDLAGLSHKNDIYTSPPLLCVHWRLSSAAAVVVSECGSYWLFISLIGKYNPNEEKNSDFTACHLFPFPQFPAHLAETPNTERPEERQGRLFYPHPHPAEMTSCLCYLAPDIKPMIPISASF